MPKVSIVIPVYGVEEYIQYSARSLFEQTFKDIEYIFINDCTKDLSLEKLMEVLDEYPHRKPQVRILHNKKNLGQSGTRKKGINAATGDYVIHCDSDDWVELDWITKLYKSAIENQADLVWCDFTKCFDDGSTQYTSNTADSTIEDGLLRLITGPRWGTLWSNLVRREIVQSSSIIWPTWNYCEDLALVFQYTALSQKIAYVNQSLYNYRIHANSICNVRDRLKRFENYNGAINATLTELKCSKRVGLYEKFRPYCLAEIFKSKSCVLDLGKTSFEGCRLWHQTVDNCTVFDVWDSNLSFKQKILATLTYFYITPFLKKLKLVH